MISNNVCASLPTHRFAFDFHQVALDLAKDNRLIANNYRQYFTICFHIEASLYLVTSLYWIQSEKTNVWISDIEKGSDLLQSKPYSTIAMP